MKQRRLLYGFSALLLTILFLTSGLFSLKAEAEELMHLVDDANLVAEQEESRINQTLAELSEEHDMDVVIFTEENGSIPSAMEAADDFFDYSGYGKGPDYSGVLLYVNMETRDVWISTRGDGITAFNDDGIDYILDEITPMLGSGDFVEAFDEYTEICEDFIIRAENGTPYGTNGSGEGYTGKNRFPAFRNLFISLLIAILVGGSYAWMLTREMKSVAPNNSAGNYIVPGSMHVQNSGEMFLFRNVTKVKRQSESGGSSGGHSSTHRSSSGARHGGGGRKF